MCRLSSVVTLRQVRAGEKCYSLWLYLHLSVRLHLQYDNVICTRTRYPDEDANATFRCVVTGNIWRLSGSHRVWTFGRQGRTLYDVLASVATQLTHIIVLAKKKPGSNLG